MNNSVPPIASLNKAEAPILIVDDDGFFRSSIVDFLRMRGYTIDEASSAETAIKLMENTQYAVIFCDIVMPGVSGNTLSSWIKKHHEKTIIVMLSGTGRINDVIESIKNGVYDYVQKPLPDITHIEMILLRALEKRQLDMQNIMLLEQLRCHNNSLAMMVGERTEAVNVAYSKLLSKNQELLSHSKKMNRTYLDIITFISDAIEQKDRYTAGHSERVRQFALMLAEEMGKDKQQKKVIERAAKLHDVGKLVIDIAFINKKGRLNSEEWEIFKKHPSTGAHMLRCLEFLRDEAELVLHHHERYDGNGYPTGKEKNETPLEGYIIGLADAIDAMLSTRSYKQALSLEETIKEIKLKSGTQFHPETVEAFINVANSNNQQLLQIIENTSAHPNFILTQQGNKAV